MSRGRFRHWIAVIGFRPREPSAIMIECGPSTPGGEMGRPEQCGQRSDGRWPWPGSLDLVPVEGVHS